VLGIGDGAVTLRRVEPSSVEQFAVDTELADPPLQRLVLRLPRVCIVLEEQHDALVPVDLDSDSFAVV
jgi:hypothetical protein